MSASSLLKYDEMLIKCRFCEASPQIFRVGDIVEVQMSLVVTPMGRGRRKMRTVLRAIALINGKFTEVRTDHDQKDDLLTSSPKCRRKTKNKHKPKSKRRHFQNLNHLLSI